MKFSEIIDRLNVGEAFTREAWEGDAIIIKQIPQIVPAEIVPRMTSLPESAKEHIPTFSNGSIVYYDQVLIVKAGCTAAAATYYIPTWTDIFAEDWRAIQ